MEMNAESFPLGCAMNSAVAKFSTNGNAKDEAVLKWVTESPALWFPAMATIWSKQSLKSRSYCCNV